MNQPAPDEQRTPDEIQEDLTEDNSWADSNNVPIRGEDEDGTGESTTDDSEHGVGTDESEESGASDEDTASADTETEEEESATSTDSEGGDGGDGSDKSGDGSDKGQEGQQEVALPDGVAAFIAGKGYNEQEAANIIENANTAVELAELRTASPEVFFDRVHTGLKPEEREGLFGAHLETLSGAQRLNLLHDLAAAEGLDLVDGEGNVVDQPDVDPTQQRLAEMQAKLDRLEAEKAGSTGTQSAETPNQIPDEWNDAAVTELEKRSIPIDGKIAKQLIAAGVENGFKVPPKYVVASILEEAGQQAKTKTVTKQPSVKPSKTKPTPVKETEPSDEEDWAPVPRFKDE